jgi:hypothetical protein
MSCSTALQTIPTSCDPNSGGILNIWLNNQDNITVATVGTPPDDWKIATLTVSSNYIAFDVRRNTANYTEDTAVDLVNGSTFVTQTINLMFHRRDKTKSEAINVLGAGQQYLSAIIRDANDVYWYFDYLQLTATGEGSGTARADGSKYSVTLVAESEHLCYEVDEAQAEAAGCTL